ncbi:MAG: hypothetical protein HMLKMBBP_02102 [Planctomycetes bacterium]|nr:hypothetical protein [Planctomycetota bacterium]
MFSKESSKVLSEKAVAVRLTGGNDITQEVSDFMQKYGVRGYPTMYVMNAQGHVLVKQVGRSLEAMEKAIADGAAAQAEWDALAAKTDPASREAQRKMLADRMAWDDLLPLVEAAHKAAPTAATAQEMAAVLRSTGKKAEEKAHLAASVKAFPDAADRTAWRLRMATMDHDIMPRSREEFVAAAEKAAAGIGALLAEVEKEGKPAATAEVRMALAAALGQAGKSAESETELDKLVADGPAKGVPAATFAQALMGKANAHFRKKELEPALGFLKRIVAECPDSPEAKQAPSGIDRLTKMLEAEKAKSGGGAPAGGSGGGSGGSGGGDAPK